MAMTEVPTLDLRRRRILEIRHHKIEEKRLKIQTLQKEMSELNEDIPLKTSLENKNVASETSEESSSVVVAVCSARKSARKMQKDPVAAMQGRQEASILARVHELQRAGLWSHKKLAKLPMPNRPKTHWDYVIEEMNWLSSVILQERKTKKLTCKKCANMVQKHFRDKESALIKAQKAHEQNLRRIAAFAAREVRTFWKNVEKVFEFTVKSQVEVKRKQAMDQHLNNIVDKTEKFSRLMAESMADNATNSVRTTPTSTDAEMDDQDEYEPDQNSDDDEATIAKDEDTQEDGELDDLNAEADIPLEDLLKKFHPELFDGQEASEPSKDDDKPDQPEQAEPQPSTSKGITGRKRSRRVISDDVQEASKEVPKASDESSDLKNLMGEENKDFYDVVEMAAKFQPTGNTLDTTSVKTPVPFLLKHTLREYQHIGLDWMVSLNERKLNGILADEMGLGKTIQTIAFLAHMATHEHVWGPHLIVVPTSVMLNWEMEIKKWAPAFKVLVYYGSQKERRLKRVGWTKPNAFHVCITSYKLVTQDHSSFRRKQWQYLILDEAQHIKNFKSQRWQLLLNFPSAGRLLLTGTPLQNNLMELWSLMHFLMPHVFESHRDFKEWFSNPLTGMVEGSSEYNASLIQRLHKVLRPFLLRRLKSEVEKQLPKKYEHVVKCPLSKRQRFLYDDFMSRAKTKEVLDSGNLLSVINVLMQLRKVCNHPNLFEPRPTISPFIIGAVEHSYPKIIERAISYNPLKSIDVSYSPLAMSNHEFHLTAFAAHRMNRLRIKKSTLEAHILYKGIGLPVPVPTGKLRMTVRSTVSPAPQPQINNKIPLQTLINNNLWKSKAIKEGGTLTIRTPKGLFILCPKNQTVVQKQPPPVTTVHMQVEQPPPPKKIHVDLPTSKAEKPKEEPKEPVTNGTPTVEKRKKAEKREELQIPVQGIFSSSLFRQKAVTPLKTAKPLLSTVAAKVEPPRIVNDRLVQNLLDKVTCLHSVNERRCNACPLYGKDLMESVTVVKPLTVKPLTAMIQRSLSEENTVYDLFNLTTDKVSNMYGKMGLFMNKFQMFVHKVMAVPKFELHCEELEELKDDESIKVRQMMVMPCLQTPETRLIQYDCGKLQVLARLLQDLKAGSHRALIFTQMTKVLDVLEAFLNFHGHTYLRLDGSTKVEQRQVLMERFNANSKYFVFILSTRSGGVGINLTGADSVIFYDSDWNPTMDAQAQDRCHRIGQTRDVHIYRLVSERSIEENILKKANQKRLLGDLAIEGGNFTTAFFKKSTVRDLFDVENKAEDNDVPTEIIKEITSENTEGKSDRKAVKAFEKAIASVEDNTDLEALKKASEEVAEDEAEFDDEAKPDDGLGTLMKQLTPVEKYALAHVSHSERFWKEAQLAAADAEIEAQKQEFDARKLEEMAENLGASMIEEQSTESDDTDVNDQDSDDDSEGDENDESSDEGEEASETSEDESDEEMKDGQGTPLSPRTRSRGDVRINLWNLEQ